MLSPRPKALIGVAAAVLLSVVIVGVAAVGYTALAKPGCGSCHDDAAFRQATQANRHPGVDCASCHAGTDVGSRVSFAYRRVFSMGFGIRQTGGRAASPVTDASCLTCHAEVLDRTTVANGYRVSHTNCTPGRSCVDCHSNTAHGDAVRWVRTSNMTDCLECHGSGDSTAACDKCHDEHTEAERLGRGAWRVTHGPNWKTAHGMGEAKSCAACHPSGFCARCHSIDLPHGPDFLIRHASDAIAKRDTCDSCHKVSFCSDCHGIEMPHPASFTPAHSARVQQSGDTKCLRCHERADCTQCHETHVHPAVTPDRLKKLGAGGGN